MRKLIRTTLFATFLLLVGVSTAPAQTTVFSETFDNDLGQFSKFSVSSNAGWTHTTSDGDGYVQINGFDSDEASDDWLISTALDLSGTTAEELTADIGKEFDGPDLKVKVSTDYSGSGDPTNANWTEEASIGSTGMIGVDLSGYTGNSEVYVAFQYTTTGTGSGEAAEFTVDDVEVTSIEDPIVRFASTTYTATEDGGATEFTVELAGPDPSNDIDVDVAFNSENSSADPGDFEGTSTTVSFSSSASSGDTKTATFFLVDDTDPEANKDAEFELKNLSSSGNASIGSPGATLLSIVDDDRTVDDARTALRNGNEEEVVLEGTVSRAFGSYARFQDESGSTGASAIVVRQTSGTLSEDFQQDISDGTIQPGTQLRVRGTLSQFSGLIQINGSDLNSYTVQGQGSPPAAQEVTLSDLKSNGEDYESELVRVTNLSFPSASGGSFEGSTTYDISDGQTTFSFRVPDAAQSNLIGKSIPTGTFTFEDVVGQFNDFGGVDDDSGYRLTGIRAMTALPVEFAGFDAVKNGSSVELTWETVSETNNAGFRVQHQAPDSDSWTRLDFVESKLDDGTTSEGASYRYTVNEELDAGTHRFRLQQKDIDGSSTPSKVVTFEKGLDEALSLEAPAPNPAQGTTTLSFGVKEATDATVSVYNVLGQQVKTLYQGTPQPEQMTDVTFNAGTLPSGVYFVRVQADGQTQTERLTVVK